MKNSKVSVGSYGWGEVCYREFEAITCGTAIMCPDMSLIETWPNIYIDNETYLSYDLDFKNFEQKLSHLISAAIIISIHSQATAVGNSGDLFLNSILIWTLFLPLGKSFSLDSIIKSLRDSKELKVEDLNNRTYGINKPIQIYSIAYLAILLQISTIYFLSALNRMDSASWKEGIAFYKNQLNCRWFAHHHLFRGSQHQEPGSHHG